jgi:hypothetical protein
MAQPFGDAPFPHTTHQTRPVGAPASGSPTGFVLGSRLRRQSMARRGTHQTRGTHGCLGTQLCRRLRTLRTQL